MIDISIIIVGTNEKHHVRKCLDSIRKSKTNYSLETIVVDNASTDGTFEMVKDEYPEVALRRNEKKIGYIHNNVMGTNNSKGRYVLLLNSDTKVQSGSLNGLLAFAQKTPDAGAVAAKLLNSDGTVQPSVFRFPTIWRAVRQYWLGREKLLDK